MIKTWTAPYLLSLIALSACEEGTRPQTERRLDQEAPEIDQSVVEVDIGFVDHAVDHGVSDLNVDAELDLDPVMPPPPSWDTPLFLKTDRIDQALGLDSLPRGHLVVAGRTEGQLVELVNLEPADGFVARVDEHGALVWVKQLGSSGVDQLLDVIYHPQGLIFAGGFSTGDVGGQVNQLLIDGMLIALNPSGEILWQTLLSLGMINRLYPTTNGVIVVGLTDQGVEAGGDFSAFVAEYDLSGARRWLTLLNSPDYDSATSVTIAEETIYVSGFTSGSLEYQTSRGDMDMFLVALSLEGELLWAKEYGGDGDDASVRISHDDEGLILSGYTNGLFADQSYGSNDIAVLKVGFDGAPLWKSQFGTSGSEAAYGLAVNPEGEIFLSGRIDEASWDQRANPSGDAFIMKLSPEGALLQVSQYGTEEGRDEFVDLILSGESLNLAGYVGTSSGDLNAVVDRLPELNSPRGYHHDE